MIARLSAPCSVAEAGATVGMLPVGVQLLPTLSPAPGFVQPISWFCADHFVSFTIVVILPSGVYSMLFSMT